MCGRTKKNYLLLIKYKKKIIKKFLFNVLMGIFLQRYVKLRLKSEVEKRLYLEHEKRTMALYNTK